MQFLTWRGIVIVHVFWDIHINSIQFIHQGDKALGIDQNIVVYWNAKGVLNLLLQGFRTRSIEGGVDLGVFGPGAVYCGVTGDRDHPHRLCCGVIAGQDDGVGVAALHIFAQ